MEEPGVLQFMGSQRVGHDLDMTWQLNNNTVSSQRSEIHSDWIGLGHKSTSEPTTRAKRMNSDYWLGQVT